MCFSPYLGIGCRGGGSGMFLQMSQEEYHPSSLFHACITSTYGVYQVMHTFYPYPFAE